MHTGVSVPILQGESKADTPFCLKKNLIKNRGEKVFLVFVPTQ